MTADGDETRQNKAAGRSFRVLNPGLGATCKKVNQICTADLHINVRLLHFLSEIFCGPEWLWHCLDYTAHAWRLFEKLAFTVGKKSDLLFPLAHLLRPSEL